MVVNSSSNEPFDHLHLSANNASLSRHTYCLISVPASIFLIIFNITNIFLLLPLFSFIIYLGLQRWRQQRSSTTATISHSDSFTYHMVAIELVGVLGNTIYLYCVYNQYVAVEMLAFYLMAFTWFGQMCFHILTCLERYLAVVHPITYLSLRKERGIRIRNITNVCVWLLCITYSCLYILEDIALDLYIFLVFFVVIVFCSLSVLCVLTRRGPGEQGGDRGRVDQSKQRAFYIITVILGVLLVKIGGSLIRSLQFVLTGSMDCFTVICDVWFNLPSTLVLPLLFLQRSGKLVCCKKNI